MSIEVSVKIEPYSDETKLETAVGETNNHAGLYEDHIVKNELVIGPEVLQPRDIANASYITTDGLQVEIIKEEYQEIDTLDCAYEANQLDIIDQYDFKTKVSEESNTYESKNKQFSYEEDKRYICDTCSKEFTTRIALVTHIKNHTGVKIYICDYCEISFFDKKTLITHIGLHIKVICEICDKTFASIENLATHKLVHGEPTFFCHSNRFNKKNSLIKHKQVHTSGKRYSCNTCNKILSSQHSLNRHKRIHTGEKPYACSVCDNWYRSDKDLENHLQKHKKITCDKKSSCINVKRTYSKFICGVCEMTFIDKRSLVTHQATHTGEKPFPCVSCEMKFATRWKLMAHKLTHMEISPNLCTICNKKFTRKSHLDVHKLLHTGEKPFTCRICKQQFRHNYSLNVHLRTHSSDLTSKPFSCDICEHTFALRSKLNIHKRIHTGEKPYSCEICDKRFRHDSTLTCHMRMHTGEKPYICETCGKRFPSSSHRWKHKHV